MEDRYVKDGKVGVLVSPGFGAGWSTWADAGKRDFLLFDPVLVQAVLDREKPPRKSRSQRESDEPRVAALEAALEARILEKYGANHGVYMGGAADLVVIWLDPGTAFIVDEYDGSESLTLKERVDYAIA